MGIRMINQVYKNMKSQQISPWTIYDKNGGNAQEQIKDIKDKKLTEKHFLSHRLVNTNKKQQTNKQTKLNDLLVKITQQKTKLNQKLNLLASLKIIRDHLSHQSNPISQVKMLLPKIKQEIFQYPGEPKHSSQHHISYRHSQKLNAINQLQGDILQDFSKIFISKSLSSNPEIKILPSVVKPQFPKVKKNHSTIVPNVDKKRQFDDNRIHEVIETTKKKYSKKKNSVTSIIYDLQI